jgi:hypothetical protein
MNYGSMTNHSFTIPEGQLSLKLSYLRVNGDLDIFNIREKEIGSLQNYGSNIGDMSGFESEVSLGISKKDSLFLNYQEWDIDYAGSTLTNRKLDIWNRYQLWSSKYTLVRAVSFDIGYRRDSGKDLTITNPTIMNSMISKVSPNSNYSIGENGDILQGGNSIQLYDSNQNLISPKVGINDMSSNSYYLRLLFGKRVFKKTVLDLYFSYIYRDITTKIDVYPSDLVPNSLETDLNRDEKVGNIGVSLVSEFRYFLFEANYEYNRIFRDKDLDFMEHSTHLDIILSFPLSKKLLFFTGGRLMFQQFNGDIPYLYNRYTETQFDKKYGFAKFGLIYKIGAF